MYRFDSWELRWLGHDSFELTSPTTTIYLDPFQVNGGKTADYILITHGHHDHYDPQVLSHLQSPKTVLLGPKNIMSSPSETAIGLAPGDSQNFPAFSVQTVEAYNTNKDFHPRADHNLGYIVTLGDKRLYHAGDTDLITEMAQLGPIDIALLPVSGTYVMTSDEAIEAAKIIKPKLAIPMHYGSIVGTVRDATQFAKALQGTCEVMILEKEEPL